MFNFQADMARASWRNRPGGPLAGAPRRWPFTREVLMTVTGPGAPEVARLNQLVERQRRELDMMRQRLRARSVVDLARGMLMDQLHCSPGEALRQLARLARESGGTITQLAAEITGRFPPEAAGDPWLESVSRARAAAELAADGDAVALALLEEVLAAAGAVAVAMWLTEPDGGFLLAGQAGFGEGQASRWRRIHPDMDTLVSQVARDGAEFWWPAGPAGGDDRPLIGHWPEGAVAALPLRDAGVMLGTIVIRWPEPLGEFPPELRRQISALAGFCAQALGARLPDGGLAADHRDSWVLGLLDGLLDSVLVAQAIRDRGEVVDFRILYVSRGFRDPAGRAAPDLVGGQLLECFPNAAVGGGLLDICVTVMRTGEPRRLSREVTAARATGAVASGGLEARVVPLWDGVAIAWQEPDHVSRLSALLQNAQRLGKIGAWEEDLITGDVSWSEATFALFGLRSGGPVRIGDLHEHAHADDVDAVRGFRYALLVEQRRSVAVFRIIRADDGSVRQLRAYAEPRIDQDGTVIAVGGAYQDVSADYRTQLAFAATTERLADTEVRVAEEHRLAMRLQEAITPRASQPADLPGLEVAARYRPAGAADLVSGDWYDTLVLPDKRVLIAVGDIAGHGLDAVTGMVAARNCLRGLAITGAAPAKLLGWLNRFAYHLVDGTYATAVCGIYDPGTGSLRLASAGHLPPILVRDGHASQLPIPGGLLLGADPSTAYREMSASLRHGDVLLLFTDGLVERRDEPIDKALESLMDAAASRPIASISAYADELLSQAGSNTGDDTCLVAVRVLRALSGRSARITPAPRLSAAAAARLRLGPGRRPGRADAGQVQGDQRQSDQRQVPWREHAAHVGTGGADQESDEEDHGRDDGEHRALLSVSLGPGSPGGRPVSGPGLLPGPMVNFPAIPLSSTFQANRLSARPPPAGYLALVTASARPRPTARPAWPRRHQRPAATSRPGPAPGPPAPARRRTGPPSRGPGR